MIKKIHICLLLVVTLLLLQLSASQQFLYQRYIPIEDIRLQAFAQTLLEEAKVIYGQGAYPIKEIYFFQSKLVHKPYLLSLADFFDWQQFSKDLYQKTPVKIQNYMDTNCSFLKKSDKLSFEQRVKVVRTLNNLIDDKDFFSGEIWQVLSITSQQQAWAGKGFWGLFEKDLPRFNRSLITTIFSQSIYPYYATGHHGEGLQNCQPLDLVKGRYAIFLRNRPKDGGRFYSELCHEIFHLLNSRLFDWYAEGFATTFSKNMSIKYNFSWQNWQQKFTAEPQNPYSLSYRLCSELDQLNNKEVNNAIKFVRIWDLKNNRYCVDQPSWFDSLTPKVRQEVKEILDKYRQDIKKNQGRINYFN